tara:strand:+ start:240 stop:560 length:321 start_codon:yes stop_codon:yes gene_type:complete
MKKISYLIKILLAGIFLYSCSSLSDASKTLRNQKTTSTDEFLVKKRQPLSVPPNFDELPTPESIIKKNNGKKSIEQKIRSSGKRETNSINERASSTEKSIINQIKK